MIINPNAELIRAQYIEVNNTWSRPRVNRLMKLLNCDVAELSAMINMDKHKLIGQLSVNKLSGEVKLHLHNLETTVLNKRLHPDS